MLAYFIRRAISILSVITMFWRGKVGTFAILESFLKQREVSIETSARGPELAPVRNKHCRVRVANINDAEGISKLLNEQFEQADAKAKTDVSPAWIKATFPYKQAIWIVAKDIAGIVRGCIASFRTNAPYPNSLGGCSNKLSSWGVVDWYCVHPLWRDKGIGREMLEALDLITYTIGRKAHVFLKEGTPLLQMPIYTTFLRCRRAGSPAIHKMRDGTGLGIFPYEALDRSSGLPLVRVEGIRGKKATPSEIKAWEDALDSDLPECWVFVSGADQVDSERGWVLDSMVSVYAFRWTPGKWLGSAVNAMIL